MIRRKRGLHTTRAMTQWPCHYGFQVKYWRYLRFLSGNRLQYACTPTVPPSEAGKLIRVCTTQPSLHHDVSAQNLMASLFLCGCRTAAMRATRRCAAATTACTGGRCVPLPHQ